MSPGRPRRPQTLLAVGRSVRRRGKLSVGFLFGARGVDVLEDRVAARSFAFLRRGRAGGPRARRRGNPGMT
jgi:hypothetical protein